ncbi:hypothetical protein DNTS_008297 [Danionella cerebrum]|uniref:Uncharacterized protein n=1 Tax=Danionella cerebrum TaxID=2873325 RepID=A0A553R6J4_9TELE|nr:hypothetical protein DNTS_008297 [Danionella translucida]
MIHACIYKFEYGSNHDTLRSESERKRCGPAENPVGQKAKQHPIEDEELLHDHRRQQSARDSFHGRPCTEGTSREEAKQRCTRHCPPLPEEHRWTDGRLTGIKHVNTVRVVLQSSQHQRAMPLAAAAALHTTRDPSEQPETVRFGPLSPVGPPYQSPQTRDKQPHGVRNMRSTETWNRKMVNQSRIISKDHGNTDETRADSGVQCNIRDVEVGSFTARVSHIGLPVSLRINSFPILLHVLTHLLHQLQKVPFRPSKRDLFQKCALTGFNREMEEAFAALYKEFLRLQALCLKQAAMLQHYSKSLQQPGLAAAPGSILEDTTMLQIQGNPKGSYHGASNDLNPIDQGLEQLHLTPQDDAVCPNPAQMVQKSTLEELRKVQELNFNQTTQKLRRQWASSFLDSDLLSQTGGLQMSEYTLQSQVCEFCQAVFPGHTHTRGEFLRHLMTHLSDEEREEMCAPEPRI